MPNGTQPKVFKDLLTDTAGHGARYLELQKSDKRFQLRALYANQWKVLDIQDAVATEIWDWATGRIRARSPENSPVAGQRSRAMEVVGRFSPEAIKRRSLTRLTLRLLARPNQSASNSGTLAMRMTDLKI